MRCSRAVVWVVVVGYCALSMYVYVVVRCVGLLVGWSVGCCWRCCCVTGVACVVVVVVVVGVELCVLVVC